MSDSPQLFDYICQSCGRRQKSRVAHTEAHFAAPICNNLTHWKKLMVPFITREDLDRERAEREASKKSLDNG